MTHTSDNRHERHSARARLSGWFSRLVRQPRPAAKRIRRWERRQFAAATFIAVLTIAALLVLFDATAITDARRLPYGVVRFFDIITDYGKSGWFLWPLALILVASAVATPILSDRAGLLVASICTRVLFLGLAIAIPGIVVNIIKGFIGRARPFVGGAADPYLFSPWTWKAAYASFPSGHGAAAASVAFAFGALWPRWRPLFWFYALMIFISRIVVTAHHPSDVLGGALIGLGGAWLVRHYFASRMLGFAVDLRGGVHPISGPSWRRIKRVAGRQTAS